MERKETPRDERHSKHNQPYPESTRIHTPVQSLQQTLNPEATSYFNVHQYTQIEEVPFMNTRIEYEDKEVIEKVAVERTVMEQREVKKIKKVPKQKTIIDYIPVQKQTFYVPTYVPETRIEYVPVEVKTERLEYVTRSRSIVHMPHKSRIDEFNLQKFSHNYPTFAQFTKYSAQKDNIKKQPDLHSASHKQGYSTARPSSARIHSLLATDPIKYKHSKNLDWKLDNGNQGLLSQERRETTNQKEKFWSNSNQNGLRESNPGEGIRQDKPSFNTSVGNSPVLR